jgi:hypothetical protein
MASRETKTLCIIGSGAVENAWDPVIQAVRESDETFEGVHTARPRQGRNCAEEMIC